MTDSSRRRKRNQRREKLYELFDEYRIPVSLTGDCYSFIERGQPDLETVLENELQKQFTYQERRMKLTRALEKVDIDYHDDYLECRNYVHQRNNRTLAETVRAVEIEHFLRTHTDYVSLLADHTPEGAQEIALRQYYHRCNESEEEDIPEEVNPARNLSISFD